MKLSRVPSLCLLLASMTQGTLLSKGKRDLREVFNEIEDRDRGAALVRSNWKHQSSPMNDKHRLQNNINSAAVISMTNETQDKVLNQVSTLDERTNSKIKERRLIKLFDGLSVKHPKILVHSTNDNADIGTLNKKPPNDILEQVDVLDECLEKFRIPEDKTDSRQNIGAIHFNIPVHSTIKDADISMSNVLDSTGTLEGGINRQTKSLGKLFHWSSRQKEILGPRYQNVENTFSNILDHTGSLEEGINYQTRSSSREEVSGPRNQPKGTKHLVNLTDTHKDGVTIQNESPNDNFDIDALNKRTHLETRSQRQRRRGDRRETISMARNQYLEDETESGSDSGRFSRTDSDRFTRTDPMSVLRDSPSSPVGVFNRKKYTRESLSYARPIFAYSNRAPMVGNGEMDSSYYHMGGKSRTMASKGTFTVGPRPW